MISVCIDVFADKLREEGHGSQIRWLQLQLLEACYSKVNFVGPDVPRAEPVAFHFTCEYYVPLVSDAEHKLNAWMHDYQYVYVITSFLMPFSSRDLPACSWFQL